MEITNKVLPRLKLGALLMAAGALLSIQTLETKAAATTITGMDTKAGQATIYVKQDGRLEFPDGSQTTASNVEYSVSMNGVYTFHTFGSNDAISRDSILVDTISRDMLVTNKPTVEVNVKSTDNHSGISALRLRNERGGKWSDWIDTRVGTDLDDTLDWALDTSQEGIRTVYAQFKDQAGNVTDSNLSKHGNTKEDAPFAKVVYTTEGPEFDVGIADKGTLSSTYWVSPNRSHVIVRSDQPYVELEFNEITSAWSNPERVYVSVGNQPFIEHDLKDLRSNSYLVVNIPPTERKNGNGRIRVYMEDTIHNKSDIQTIDYFYDDAVPTASVNVKQNNGSNLTEGTYYNQKTQANEEVLITETESVFLDVNLKDVHSKVANNSTHPGFARVLIEERTRYEQDGPWRTTSSRVFAENRQLAGSHPFTNRKLRDGQTHRMEMPLSNGFETQFRISVTDNAGNTRTINTVPFRQSNLQLISFKVLDIINPSRENEEVTFTNHTAPQAMSAGGNVTVEAMYYWLTAFEPENISGQIRIQVTGDGYSDTQYIELKEENILNDKSYPRFEETFTVPEDAPVGAIVTMQGFIRADMEDDVTHTIYFPSKNRNISQQIGVVDNHIQDALHFNITR